MRKWAVLVLLLAGAQAWAAPAPLPRPQRARPAPGCPDWEIDFTPLAAAGQVSLGFELTVKAADGETWRSSVGQSGRVLIRPIIEVFARHFSRHYTTGGLVIDRDFTRMTFKSLSGARITSVE